MIGDFGDFSGFDIVILATLSLMLNDLFLTLILFDFPLSLFVTVLSIFASTFSSQPRNLLQLSSFIFYRMLSDLGFEANKRNFHVKNPTLILPSPLHCL